MLTNPQDSPATPFVAVGAQPRANKSMRPPRLVGMTRDELLGYFDDGWQLNECLFAAVADDALFARPDPLRHPLIFYYGHTAAFYINKMVMAGLLAHGLDDSFERLFAKGVDPASARELQTISRWPARQAVRDYRQQVYQTVRQYIERADLEPRIDDSSAHWALLMGCEHERIHFETSSVLCRQAPLSLLRRPQGWTYAPTDTGAPARQWCHVPARQVVLGRGRDIAQYGWDNEYGHLPVATPAFETTACLVSNADFAQFWRAGGYGDERLWHPQGWRWRVQHEVTAPRFWITHDSSAEPRYRAMFDELDMPWSWPVEVNCFEAQAYCAWVGGGARLMSEAEWSAAAQDAPLYDGDCIGHPGYNLDLCHGSPTPVDHLPAGRSALGLYDIHGNVWQWFADDFQPLPGFAPHPLYTDFSAPYFTEHHAVMRGGSWASTGTSASRHYRLWFRRHFYQHAGFRLARDL